MAAPYYKGLVGEYRRSGFRPHLARVYRCRALGGQATPSIETPRVAWWDPARLPDTLFPWFRGPLRDRVREALTGPTLEETGMFDMAVVSTMVERHQSGRSDYQAALWALLMFQSFLQQVHGCPVSPKRDLAPEVATVS